MLVVKVNRLYAKAKRRTCLRKTGLLHLAPRIVGSTSLRTMPNLVASITSWHVPRMARPTSSSFLSSGPYISAVSKLMPSSRAYE